MILKGTLEHSGIPLDVLAHDAAFMNAKEHHVGILNGRVRTLADQIVGRAWNVYYQEGDFISQLLVFENPHHSDQVSLYQIDSSRFKKVMNSDLVLNLAHESPMYQGPEAIARMIMYAEKMRRFKARHGGSHE